MQALKNQDLRFTTLIGALLNAREEQDLPLATGVAVFLNTILSAAFEFEQRVNLRYEMIEGDMLQAIISARTRFLVSPVSYC